MHSKGKEKEEDDEEKKKKRLGDRPDITNAKTGSQAEENGNMNVL